MNFLKFWLKIGRRWVFKRHKSQCWIHFYLGLNLWKSENRWYNVVLFNLLPESEFKSSSCCIKLKLSAILNEILFSLICCMDTELLIRKSSPLRWLIGLLPWLLALGLLKLWPWWLWRREGLKGRFGFTVSSRMIFVLSSVSDVIDFNELIESRWELTELVWSWCDTVFALSPTR